MKKGQPEEKASGQLTGDSFTNLVTELEGVHAKVNMSVAQSLEYGELKVSASVTLTCDQNESAINKAAELAFKKALEVMQDGFSLYNVQVGPDAFRGNRG